MKSASRSERIFSVAALIVSCASCGLGDRSRANTHPTSSSTTAKVFMGILLAASGERFALYPEMLHHASCKRHAQTFALWQRGSHALQFSRIKHTHQRLPFSLNSHTSHVN